MADGDLVGECPQHLFYRGKVQLRGDLYELYACSLIGALLGSPPGIGWGKVEACCLPSRGGECTVPLGIDPANDRHIQERVSLGLQAMVIDGWRWEENRFAIGWNHERGVIESVAVHSRQETRRFLTMAVVRGLDPEEAQRLINLHCLSELKEK